jgi:prevent-host-death family protein
VKTIKASEFKARCLALMDEVAASGEPIVITKNGEPISQLVPYRRPLKTLFGLHRDTLRIEGDIVSPVAVDWEAER